MTADSFTGRFAALVLADEHTLLMFGSAADPLPPAGIAVLEGSDAEGSFRARSWEVAGEVADAVRFVAVLRLDSLARRRPGRLGVALPDGGSLIFPRFTNVRIDPVLLLTALQAQAPESLADVFDFLREALDGPDKTPTRRVRRFLAQVLTAISRPDGFMEILGRLGADGGLLVQGWSRQLAPGRQEMLAQEEEPGPVAGVVARFARSDLPPGAHGILALLPDCGIAPDRPVRLHFRTPAGWFHLDPFEGRTRLEDFVALPHLRDMLPQLKADAPTLKALKRLAHGRFEGRETLSRLDLPLRAALDHALLVPQAGLFLTGWLLDPEGLAGAVTLRGPGGGVRLDPGWSRTPRPDVTQAFAGETRFAGRLLPGEDDHGFMAWVPLAVPAQPGDLYLEILLPDRGDGSEKGGGEDAVAFLPVVPTPALPDHVARLTGLLNPADPLTDELVARQIGPLAQALGQVQVARPRPLQAPRLHRLGRELAAPRLTAVVPVLEPRPDLDLLLARLALDPEAAGLDLLVVAGHGSAPGLGQRLRQAAEFQRLSVRLVAAAAARTVAEALDVGVRLARTDRLLLLSPAVVPLAHGWLPELEAALDEARGRALVAPTLLHDDLSIRSAGYQLEAGGPDGTVLLVRAYAGYPTDWLPGGGPGDDPVLTVPAVDLDCLLLERPFLEACGGLPAGFAGTEAAAIDLSLRARAAGGRCLWLPGTRLFAVETAPADPQAETASAGLVDRWLLARRWPDPLRPQAISPVSCEDAR